MWTLTNSVKAQIAEKQCLYLLTNLSERQSYPHKMKVEFIAWILWSQNSQNSQILQSVVFKKKKEKLLKHSLKAPCMHDTSFPPPRIVERISDTKHKQMKLCGGGLKEEQLNGMFPLIWDTAWKSWNWTLYESSSKSQQSNRLPFYKIYLTE